MSEKHSTVNSGSQWIMTQLHSEHVTIGREALQLMTLSVCQVFSDRKFSMGISPNFLINRDMSEHIRRFQNKCDIFNRN